MPNGSRTRSSGAEKWHPHCQRFYIVLLPKLLTIPFNQYIRYTHTILWPSTWLLKFIIIPLGFYRSRQENQCLANWSRTELQQPIQSGEGQIRNRFICSCRNLILRFRFPRTCALLFRVFPLFVLIVIKQFISHLPSFVRTSIVAAKSIYIEITTAVLFHSTSHYSQFEFKLFMVMHTLGICMYTQPWFAEGSQCQAETLPITSQLRRIYRFIGSKFTNNIVIRNVCSPWNSLMPGWRKRLVSCERPLSSYSGGNGDASHRSGETITGTANI